jgi:hypothetical protein
VASSLTIVAGLLLSLVGGRETKHYAQVETQVVGSNSWYSGGTNRPNVFTHKLQGPSVVLKLSRWANQQLAAIPAESAAATVYVPAGTSGTPNAVVKAPEASVVAGNPVTPPAKDTAIAELSVNPEPVTLTKVPTSPEDALSTIEVVAA